LLQYLVDNQQEDGSFGNPVHDTFAPLALLSSGLAKYRPAVERNMQHHVALINNQDLGLRNWYYMNAAIVISEYYLATGEKWVLPELQKVHDLIAEGQYLRMSQINPKAKESHPDSFPKGPETAHGGWGHNPGFEGYGPIAMITGQGALAYSLMHRCGITIDRANHDAAFLDKSELAVASRNCSAAVVKVLIDGGATLDMKDVWGWTPLMHAIDAHTGSSSREPVLMLLLDAGASVDVWGKDLKGPLDMMEAREEQIKKAREQEASIGKQTSSHLTAPGAANPVVDSRACEARRLSVNQPRRLTNIMRQKSGGGSGCRRSLDSETPNFCVAGHQYVSSSPVPPRFSAVANASERV
jgi:hypothetical protein